MCLFMDEYSKYCLSHFGVNNQGGDCFAFVGYGRKRLL